MKDIPKQICFALLFLIIGWLACTAYYYATRKPGTVPAVRGGTAWEKDQTVCVDKMFDGDSGVLTSGREFRLVGIDAPEKGEPFAEEARTYVKELLEGEIVEIEPAVDPVDRYGRKLAWLWVIKENKRKIINLEIVRMGYAYVYQFRRNARYSGELVDAQRRARAARLGIWSIQRKNVEKNYVVSAGLTHRPNCGKMLKGKKKKVRYDTFDEAVDTGAPPCRNCKP